MLGPLEDKLFADVATQLADITAQFEAIGSTRLANGALLSLGPVAADWSAVSLDPAKRSEDEHFSGQIDQRGRFLPAPMGSKPARGFSGEHVDFSVIARSREADHAEGRAQLIVTGEKKSTASIY